MPQTTTPIATVMEYLSSDHQRLDGLMTAAGDRAKAGDMNAAAAGFGEFMRGLLRHIRIEEELLFPAFEGATGLSQGGPTSVMKLEHAEIQRLLGSIRDLFDSGDPQPAEFESLRSALVALLHEHNLKEERVLYPATDQTLDEGGRDALVRQIQRS